MLASGFLFTGENSYTLFQQLNNRKTSFVQKYGADSLFEFSSQNWDLSEIRQSLYAGGLFVSKKMIIIYGVPKDSIESNTMSTDKYDEFLSDFQEHQNMLSPDSLVVLVSYKPDKRTKAYKRFVENVQVKDFPLYKELQLKVFIKEQLSGFSVSDELLSYFLLKIGTDMFRLDHEIEKLKIGLQAHSKTQISIEDVDYYCFGLTEQDGFELFDHLLTDPVATIKILDKMQLDGKNRNEVHGLLLRGLKVDLMLLDCDNQGITGSKEIIAKTKLHPFVVNKNLKYLPLFRQHKAFIVGLFKHLIQLEYDIKTGKKTDQFFWFFLKTQILGLIT